MLDRIVALAAAALLGFSAHAQLPVEPHANPLALLASGDPQLAANKKLVFDFWRTVVQAHDVDRAAEFLTENFVQHDPNLATGRAAFLRSLGRASKQPVKETIDDLVSVVAERDLVVLGFRRELADLENEGQTYTTASFDMFRIEGGKIAEHWNSAVKD